MVVSLAEWGLLFYGGYKFSTVGKDNIKKEVFLLPLAYFNVAISSFQEAYSINGVSLAQLI